MKFTLRAIEQSSKGSVIGYNWQKKKFLTHLCYKTFQCLLNLSPYFSTPFIPSRLQHIMLMWVFWTNVCIIGLKVMLLEVLRPGISQNVHVDAQHFNIFPFKFSFFKTFFLSWIFLCQVAEKMSYRK